MNIKVITINDKKYIECVSSESKHMTEQNTLELVAACIEHDTGLLMLDGEVLPDDFFRLSTGVAGAVLQKLANYHIKTAAVVSCELAGKGKFREMAVESNRGNHFRIFSTKEEAESWLINIK